MDTNTKNPRSKLIHWLSRIGTTFGLAGASWLFLSWADLQGGVFYAGLLCALTAHEFSGSTNPNLKSFRRWALTIISFFTPYFFYRVLQSPEPPIMTIRLFELFMVLFLVMSLAALAYPSVLKVICNSMLFPIWGISLPLTSLIFVAHYFMTIGRTSTEALLWVITIIFVTKATDIGALLVGSIFGKHKLAPKTSPGKTIEGAIGGVIVSILVALSLYWIGNIQLTSASSMPIGFSIPKIILCVGIISLSGILGDLFESSWKRFYKMKDSGECLPGLGGVYDLTDSIIMSAPVSYFLLKYFLFS